MTHYIDISPAVHSRAGLGRYSAKLAAALDQAQPGRFSLFYNQGTDGRVPSQLTHLPQRYVKWGYKPWRLAILLAHFSRLSFNRLVPNANLFHSTEHLLLPVKHLPTVLTVHDLIYKIYPQYHKRLNYWYLNLAMPIYCRRATAIVAVSESSKRDIVKHYHINPDKIHVIYEAAAPHFRPPVPSAIDVARQKFNLPDRYLIHLSTIEPRKNLSRLLDALKILRQDDPHLHLVLVGSTGWLYDELLAKIETDGLSNYVHRLGWVDDELLPAVIGNATLAVQPSLYEGFGLPILEHMACSQVVAASNASSHPEVGGDAAAYFDPYNVDEMAATIHRLLNDPEEYQYRRHLGYHQARKFSWQRAAKETIALYDKLV
ncbi:MAG TPA: glycosyltransferase family 1 protein [Anaerolineae bacterium]|nr:glycosyltransferase family 1 protein [Anaerolineae bacterium]